MNAGLLALIRDYQASVADAVSRLESAGIARPATASDWVVNRLPSVGSLPDGCHYFKHGIGCAVRLPTVVVDFDFGDHGENDGFDPYRLIKFAGRRITEYGFTSEDAVQQAVDDAVDDGEVLLSGYTLYFLVEEAF